MSAVGLASRRMTAALGPEAGVDVATSVPGPSAPTVADGRRAATVRIRGVSKRFPGTGRGGGSDRWAHEALSDIDLDVEPGQIVTILGPSGCGKTTLLNCIAGMMPYDGTITVDGQPVTAPNPGVAVVFQSPHLLPWRTALGNAEYALEIEGTDKRTRREKARQMLDLVGLSDAAGRYPAQLSGGMRQRANIARALAVEPRLLLMDEPFGALDAITKEHLQEELLGIVARSGVTTIFVTHDIGEAIFLGDLVITMAAGPGRIVVRQPIEEPKPRHLNWKRSTVFQEHYGALWDALLKA